MLNHILRNGHHRFVLFTVAAICIGLLEGCSLLGPSNSAQSQRYAPDPRITADPAWPSVDWQLSMSQPSAARMIDTYRIVVRPTPDEIEVYKGAAWAKLPSDMLQDTITRALEDSGRIPAIAFEASGIAADYKLVLDIRRFEADYSGNHIPSAIIEVNAKLLHTVDQSIVGSHTFKQARQANSTDVASVVDAFSDTLKLVSGDITGWVLVTGNAHELNGHARPPAGSTTR